MTQPNTGKYFPTYFSSHYQTSENTFPEFTFSKIHFFQNSLSKKNYFPANKRGRKTLLKDQNSASPIDTCV